MKNKYITALKEYKQFEERNTSRIIRYRTRSFFNLKNNKIDRFFVKNKLTKNIFIFWIKICCAIKFLLQKKISIPQIDFLITTNCTLNCKNCATLIPYYDKEKKYNISLSQFKSDLDKLLSSVDKIYRLKLIGGEPLIVNELNEMLEYVCSKKQIVSVEITTNGTIIPDDNICNTLRKYNTKALVILSDYSDNKYLTNIKFNEIKNKLEKYNVYTILSKYDWFEIGKIKQQNRNEDALKNTFMQCWQRHCIAIANGTVYNCTRAAAISHLTTYKFSKDDILNIRCDETEFLIKKFNKFYDNEFYSFCDFCTTVLQNSSEIAEQLKKHDETSNNLTIEYDL